MKEIRVKDLIKLLQAEKKEGIEYVYIKGTLWKPNKVLLSSDEVKE